MAVTAPAIIGTGVAVHWLAVRLGLEGAALTAYYMVGVGAIMWVFAVLHRFVRRFGHAMLGATRSPYWQV